MNRFILISIMMFFLASCKSHDPAQIGFRSVSGNEDLNIESENIGDLKSKALEGSGTAAMKLSEYYDFIKFDNQQALYWSTIAAENGNVAAMHNVGVILLSQEQNNNEAKIRAKYWLKLAAKRGNKNAASLIKELD